AIVLLAASAAAAVAQEHVGPVSVEHDLHSRWGVHMLSGQQKRSVAVAQALAARVSAARAGEDASLQAFLTASFLTHVRFGDWMAVLSSPRPADGLSYANAMWHHARGVAHAVGGDL